MIDLTNRTIKGKSGKTYYIDTENISVARWPEFEIQSSEISWNASFSELADKWKEVFKLASNGNDVIGALAQIRDIAKTANVSIVYYNDNPIPRIIKYCSIFCNEKNEDLSIYTETLIRSKYEDWKHIPMKDFFLLSALATPDFVDAFNRELEMLTKEGNPIPELPYMKK